MARMHDSQLAWDWGSSSSGTGGGTVTRHTRPRQRRRKRSCPQAPSLEALAGSPESVRYLWRLYRFNPEHLAYRDRLVEFYLPWARGISESIAKRIGLPDRENAVGECLLCFGLRIVPAYNGRGEFTAFATLCIKRRLVDMFRRGKNDNVTTIQTTEERNWIEGYPCDEPTKRGVKFKLITQGLTALQRKIIRLRFQRYLSVEETADVLGCSKSSVKHQTQQAVAAIRKKWGDCRDELRR